MATFEIAKLVADAYFDELRASAKIRQAFHDLVVSNAGILFAAFDHDDNLKRRLKEALKLKRTDQSALLRGLFVQAIGVFDDFIRSLIATTIEQEVGNSRKYSGLKETLRNGFIAQSGRVLSHYGSGTVNGVRYDFSRLTRSLAACLSDTENYFVEPRVFTIMMGNSTPERLEKLFSTVGLPEPFSPELGENAELKKAMRETRKAAVAQLAEKRLGAIINMRNDIVHGDLTVALSYEEFVDNIDVLCALTNALKELCEKPRQ